MILATVFSAILLVAYGYLVSLPPATGLGYVGLVAVTVGGTALCRFGRALALYTGASWCVAWSAYASGAPVAVSVLAQFAYAVLMAAPAALPGRWWKRGLVQILAPSVPPLAYWLPLPPLAGAGWIFPGAGAFGVAAFVALALAVGRASGAAAERTSAPRRQAALVLAAVALVHIGGRLMIPVPGAPAGWAAWSISSVDAPPLSFEEAVGVEISLARRLTTEKAVAVIAPENVLGTLPLAGMRLLKETLRPGQEMLIGGIQVEHGRRWKGAWVLPHGYFVRAVAPIPLIEPYGAEYSRVGETVMLQRTPASLLVCFEASTSMPLFHLHAGVPVILIANGWWDTAGALDIQEAIAGSWARVFGLPLITSAVRP